MTNYSLTRPGAITAATLQDALRRHGRPALAVLVHRNEIDAAVKALAALGLPLPVQKQPGVLVGEIGVL